jgi:nitrogen PTS system EIIA component
MPDIASLIAPQAVLLGVEADCPKAVFRAAAEHLARLNSALDAREVAAALAERERVGSTAMGQGVSIPHARLPLLQTPLACLLRLQKPIRMESDDNKPVDLFFVLLVPRTSGQEHLRTLSSVARLIRMPEALEALREADSAAQIVETLRFAGE